MRPFRFGVNLISLDGRDEWLVKCRAAESLGYDIISVPDHLGSQAPFPALVAAAGVTERIRLATFVLNSAFWNPVLLAREVMTTNRLTGGRLELGIGTGYVRSEFEKARTEWGSSGSRVRRLKETVAEVTRLLDHPREIGDPNPADRPPLMIGANGDRVIRLAARHADIVSFSAARLKPGAARGALELLDADEVEERVRYFEGVAGDRAQTVERNILAQTVVVTTDRLAAAASVRRRMPHLTAEQVMEIPTVLIGTPDRIAGQLRDRRDPHSM
jgi:probable F420-dependent oxidoreductase